METAKLNCVDPQGRLCLGPLKLVQFWGAGQNNKPVTLLEQRGDFVRLKQAEQSGHLVLVLEHVDFVGGLEFNGGRDCGC